MPPGERVIDTPCPAIHIIAVSDDGRGVAKQVSIEWA